MIEDLGGALAVLIRARAVRALAYINEEAEALWVEYWQKQNKGRVWVQAGPAPGPGRFCRIIGDES